jgi:excisionase family DNA binding protein
MNSSLDKIRARANLLLASDKWRDLVQLLERDVPTLIAEVEQLQLELAEIKGQQKRWHPPTREVLQRATDIPAERHALSCKEFARCIGVSEASVRRWAMVGTIKVVRFGHLIRIPRTELVRLIERGGAPVRLSRS